MHYLVLLILIFVKFLAEVDVPPSVLSCGCNIFLYLHSDCTNNNYFCRISVPYPFQWGAPTFDAGESFAMMVAAFVALVEVCLRSFTQN